MEYNITLNLMTYVVVLISFGIIGSCFEAYKTNKTVKPFLMRLITGAFAGSITMLVVYILQLDAAPPIIHFGISVILGLMAEKGETGKIVDLVFNRGGNK